MGISRRLVALIVFLFPVLVLAEPGFPEWLGAEAVWADGPEGAYRPLSGGVVGESWYVDGQNGLDTNDGSAGAPFETIARGLEVAGAGDEIVVLAGTYHEQIMPPDISASRARPVLLRAEPADGQSVILDGQGVVLQAEGGFGIEAGVSLNGDSAFVVQGFRIQNFSGYGLAVQQSSDVIVLDCVFADNGSGLNDSVDLILRSATDTRVLYNRFESANERALDDRSTDAWIAHNSFAGYLSNAVKLGPYPDGRGTRLEHNVFVDNPASQGVIYAGDARGVTIQRNLVVGGNLQGIRLDGVDDGRILLNTVVGAFTGLQVRNLNGCRVAGNVLADNTMGLEYLSLSLPATEIDYNLYWGNQADVEMGQAGPNDLFVEPGFTDPDNGDYSLLPGGGAVDAGPADLPVPDGGGALVDLGAFEAGAGEPPYDYPAAFSVADPTPALTWLYVDRDGTAAQGAYRVQLDRAPTFDTEELIDSNWQMSADPTWTVPRTMSLIDGLWYARIQLRDGLNHAGPWSDPHLAMAVGPAPTCAAQAGQGCAVLDACEGQWLEAQDDSRCCLGSCVACPDADGDMHQDAACGGADCDDGDPNVNPDAIESCDNAVDDDCDGATDLADSDCGCVDHDLDGYGENCPDGPDCDDAIASVHPGAEELCNYVDDDCDGETDEGVDVNSDPDNCGECFWACRPAEVCDLGTCADDCTGGRSDCERACIDTQADLANCGDCGQMCDLPNASETCSAGACLLTLCESGFVDQNGDPADGCEYACTPTGEEICKNGLDDNCDGQVDEDCKGKGGGCVQGGGDGGAAPWAFALLVPWWIALRRRSGRP